MPPDPTAPPDTSVPPDTSAQPDTSALPIRPAMIEAAAAILIVVGVAGAAAQVLALAAGTAVPATGAEPLLVVQYALIVLTIAAGLLVRAGRAWLLCLGVVAVILLLDLAAIPSGSVFALLFVGLDAIVLVSLVRHRSWFARHGTTATAS